MCNTLPFHTCFYYWVFCALSLIYIVRNEKLVLLTLRQSQRWIVQKYLAALTDFVTFFLSFLCSSIFFIWPLMCLLLTVSSTRNVVTPLHTLTLLLALGLCISIWESTGNRKRNMHSTGLYPTSSPESTFYLHHLEALFCWDSYRLMLQMEKSCKVIFEIVPAEPTHVKKQELCFLVVRKTESSIASAAQRSE